MGKGGHVSRRMYSLVMVGFKCIWSGVLINYPILDIIEGMNTAPASYLGQ